MNWYRITPSPSLADRRVLSELLRSFHERSKNLGGKNPSLVWCFFGVDLLDPKLLLWRLLLHPKWRLRMSNQWTDEVKMRPRRKYQLMIFTQDYLSLVSCVTVLVRFPRLSCVVSYGTRLGCFVQTYKYTVRREYWNMCKFFALKPAHS